MVRGMKPHHFFQKHHKTSKTTLLVFRGHQLHTDHIIGSMQIHARGPLFLYTEFKEARASGSKQSPGSDLWVAYVTKPPHACEVYRLSTP